MRGERPAGRTFGSGSPRDGPVERRGGREAGRHRGRALSSPGFRGEKRGPGSVRWHWGGFPFSVFPRRLQGGFVTRARQRAGFVFLNEEASVSRTRGLGGGRRFFYSTAYYTGVFSHLMPYLVSSVLTTHTILTPVICKVLFKQSWYPKASRV